MIHEILVLDILYKLWIAFSVKLKYVLKISDPYWT